ncbi:hypothetical protein QYE76_041999 [Lolium multiflorum]|uniref:Retrotransposon gag domain-containing protein n=1 Tax=Lolium multiflorum TaxID=4521 RepID=A0AAD8WWJ3_LOLMU|nr:hypothetical protein QYE76_041999 [Lolium multiflorum]
MPLSAVFARRSLEVTVRTQQDQIQEMEEDGEDIQGGDDFLSDDNDFEDDEFTDEEDYVSGMAPPNRNQDAMLQLLQTLLADREDERAERQANIAALQQIANQGHGNHDHPGSKLKNFQNTNPPVFSKTEEPLDADDWLQTMENNLEVAGVDENEKVLFATHYLAGPARAWWTSARALNAGQMMTWADFKLKFSKYHVPPGLIKKMRDEFTEARKNVGGRIPRQVPHPVKVRPDETDTTEKRKERFLNGSNAIPVRPRTSPPSPAMNVELWDTFPMSAPKGWPSSRQHLCTQQQRRVSTGKKFAPNNPNNRGGRLYHMNAEEAQEAPDVVLVLFIPFLCSSGRHQKTLSFCSNVFLFLLRFRLLPPIVAEEQGRRRFPLRGESHLQGEERKRAERTEASPSTKLPPKKRSRMWADSEDDDDDEEEEDKEEEDDSSSSAGYPPTKRFRSWADSEDDDDDEEEGKDRRTQRRRELPGSSADDLDDGDDEDGDD